jgi:hypothetical protein
MPNNAVNLLYRALANGSLVVFTSICRTNCISQIFVERFLRLVAGCEGNGSHCQFKEPEK